MKGRNRNRQIADVYSALSGLLDLERNQGRRASLRCALAPGYHIPRPWRTDTLALGAQAWAKFNPTRSVRRNQLDKASKTSDTRPEK